MLEDVEHRGAGDRGEPRRHKRADKMVHGSNHKGVQDKDMTRVSTKDERGTSPSSTMSVPASKHSSLTHSASSTRTSSPESCTKCASFVTRGLPPAMSPTVPSRGAAGANLIVPVLYTQFLIYT